jgi:hypothetical protein
VDSAFAAVKYGALWIDLDGLANGLEGFLKMRLGIFQHAFKVMRLGTLGMGCGDDVKLMASALKVALMLQGQGLAQLGFQRAAICLGGLICVRLRFGLRVWVLSRLGHRRSHQVFGHLVLL